MSRKNVKVAIAFGVVVASVIFLLLSGLQDTMVYFITVSELQAKGDEAFQKSYRVEGIVVPGSLQSNENRLEFTFLIEDGGSTLRVKHRGVLPDTFKEGLPVLVEGRYLPEGTFVAEEVFTKCPSKYESAEEYETSMETGENPS
jgi:cytochrome c-type biogenesis protein CcmE